MNLRGIKEAAAVFKAPAKELAKRGVSPNHVTLAGGAAAVAAELITVYAQNVQENETTFTNESVGESNSENTISEKETEHQAVLLLVLLTIATLLRFASLYADGLDGSVARARKELDPEYTNTYGSIIDALIDRLVNIVRKLVLMRGYARQNMPAQMKLAGLSAVEINIPGLERALIEARGGKTVEQSLNLLKLGGTQAVRVAIDIATSLDHIQIAALFPRVTKGQWEVTRTALLGYQTVSTGAVIVQRAQDLMQTFHTPPILSDAEENHVDSAGFSDKSREMHLLRAKVFAITTAIAGLSVPLLMAFEWHRSRKNTTNR